jgi:positive regulator of sigma E activity
MGHFLLFLIGIVVACIGSAAIADQLFDDYDYDPAAMFGCSIVIILGFLIAIAGMKMYSEKIESKTPIQPEVIVVTKNGVSDTTYVYRR